MTKSNKIICVIGTRPEAIKMAPVIRALQASSWAHCVVVTTAQHRSLLDQMLQRLDINIDYDFDLMQQDQTPLGLLSRMLPALETIIHNEAPAAVLAQGDTTTVFGAALAAFHHRTPFGHVEAGLRTGNLTHPFPEEGYRQMVSRITQWHFSPTQSAAAALRSEGIPDESIYVTGNTCIDALLQTVNQLPPLKTTPERLILLTVHRRESFGPPLRSVFEAIKEITAQYTDVRVVYPVHPNPSVRKMAHAMLSNHPRIDLREPLDYFEFVDLMRHSTLILTDSGGIQEEAPSLRKPVLVLRETTERPETVEMGLARLIGTDTKTIFSAVRELLEDDSAYQHMARGGSPYGNGDAALNIAHILKDSIASYNVGFM